MKKTLIFLLSSMEKRLGFLIAFDEKVRLLFSLSHTWFAISGICLLAALVLWGMADIAGIDVRASSLTVVLSIFACVWGGILRIGAKAKGKEYVRDRTRYFGPR